MKELVDDLLSALYVMRCSFESYDTVEVFKETDGRYPFLLTEERPSPESIVIRNDIINRLDTETKWVMEQLLYFPERLATPVNGVISRHTIVQFLKKKKWKRSKIEKTLREIQKCLQELREEVV